MRVQGPNASTVATPGAKTRRSSAGGFSLTTEESSQTAAGSPAALRTIGGIDALIALQADEGQAGRRKRAVLRGRIVLDALDELKQGLLAGDIAPTMLLKLKTAAAELKSDTGEVGLDEILKEIELRVEVEIAKLSVRRESAGGRAGF